MATKGGAAANVATRIAGASGGTRNLPGTLGLLQTQDLAHFADQLLSAFQRSAGPQRRRIDRVDRSAAQSLVHVADVRLDIGRRHQDRTGASGHDSPCRFGTVHHRHDHVHQDQVGPILLASFDRLLTVLGQPGHLRIRHRLDDAAEDLRSHAQVIHYRDSHPSRSSMRSRTVVMKVSS